MVKEAMGKLFEIVVLAEVTKKTSDLLRWVYVIDTQLGQYATT